MKKYFFLTALFVYGLCFGQQESSEKPNSSGLTYHGITFGVPILSGYSANNRGGPEFNASLTLSYQKHLFSLGWSYGDEFAIIGGIGESYNQYNLQYGREIALSRTIFLELHGGAGLFSYKSLIIDPLKEGKETVNAIAFPLKAKLRVHTGPRFSIGIQAGHNINSEQNINSVGLFIQWNVRKW